MGSDRPSSWTCSPRTLGPTVTTSFDTRASLRDPRWIPTSTAWRPATDCMRRTRVGSSSRSPAIATSPASALQSTETTWPGTRDAESWERLLTERNVGCVRADGASVGEFFTQDPHVLANGLAPRCQHARFGQLRRWGPLTTVDGALPGYGPSPLAGEHTDALLEELGHTVAEIAHLRKAGVVASEPIQAP